MAKKKKRKSESSSKVKFSSELTGLIFVLISVIGIGAFGPVGHFIKSFAIFLMGNYWAIAILLFMILGLYMIVKRDLPKFFSGRLIGLYFLLIALLAFSHIEYINDSVVIKDKSIFENTFNNLMNTFSDENFINLSNTGGGIIGVFFAWGLVNLFDLNGTYIVLGVLGIFGVVMALNVSLADIIKKIFGGIKRFNKGLGESRIFKASESDDDDEEDEERKKILES